MTLNTHNTALSGDTLYQLPKSRMWFLPHLEAHAPMETGYNMRLFGGHEAYRFHATDDIAQKLDRNLARRVLNDVQNDVEMTLRYTGVNGADVRDVVMHITQMLASQDPVRMGAGMAMAQMYLRHLAYIDDFDNFALTMPFQILQRRAVNTLSAFYACAYGISHDEALMLWSESLNVQPSASVRHVQSMAAHPESKPNAKPVTRTDEEREAPITQPPKTKPLPDGPFTQTDYKGLSLRVYENAKLRPGFLTYNDKQTRINQIASQVLAQILKNMESGVSMTRSELASLIFPDSKSNQTLTHQAMNILKQALQVIAPNQEWRLYLKPRQPIALLMTDEKDPVPAAKVKAAKVKAPSTKVSTNTKPAQSDMGPYTEIEFHGLTLRLYSAQKRQPGMLIYNNKRVRISEKAHNMLAQIMHNTETNTGMTLVDLSAQFFAHSSSARILASHTLKTIKTALDEILPDQELVLHHKQGHNLFLLPKGQPVPTHSSTANLGAYTEIKFQDLSLRLYDVPTSRQAVLVYKDKEVRVKKLLHDILADIIRNTENGTVMTQSQMAALRFSKHKSSATMMSVNFNRLKSIFAQLVPQDELQLVSRKNYGLFLSAPDQDAPAAVPSTQKIKAPSAPVDLGPFTEIKFHDLALRLYSAQTRRPGMLVYNDTQTRISKMTHDILALVIQNSLDNKSMTQAQMAQHLFAERANPYVLVSQSLKILEADLAIVAPNDDFRLFNVRHQGVRILTKEQPNPLTAQRAQAPRKIIRKVPENNERTPRTHFNRVVHDTYHFMPKLGLVIDMGPTTVSAGGQDISGRYYRLIGGQQDKPLFISQTHIARIGYGPLDTPKFIERLRMSYDDIYTLGLTPQNKPVTTSALQAAFDAHKAPDTLAALLVGFKDARVQSKDGSVALRKNIMSMMVQQVAVFHNFAPLNRIEQHLEFLLRNRKNLSAQTVWPYDSAENFEHVIQRIEQESAKARLQRVELNAEDKKPVIYNAARDSDTDLDRFLANTRARGHLILAQ